MWTGPRSNPPTQQQPNSHHQDYHPFSVGNPINLFFATDIRGGGLNPGYAEVSSLETMDFQPKAFEKNRAELPRPAPLPPASHSLIQSFGRGV